MMCLASIDSVWRYLPPILQACAGSDTRCFRLSGPWIHGEFVYVTDGAALGRIPVHKVAPAALKRIKPLGNRWKRPPAAPMFDHHWREDEIALPDLGPMMLDCPDCKATGAVRYLGSDFECERCAGDGWIAKVLRVPLTPDCELTNVRIWLLRFFGVLTVRKAVDARVPQVYWKIGNVEGLLMQSDDPEQIKANNAAGRGYGVAGRRKAGV